MTEEILAGAVVAVCNMVGAAVKHQMPNVSNRLIPVLLLPIGTLTYVTLSNRWNHDAAVAGFMCALSAVGVHQVLKQSLVRPPRAGAYQSRKQTTNNEETPHS